jgi:hypothetical protein
MIGEEIPNAINIFLGIYTLIILVLAFFINRYFIRKNSSIFINILCVFLWFTILLMIIVFPLDLFSNFLFEDNDENKNNTKIFSSFLYWNFYVFGFVLVDQIKNYITDGNFTAKTKIISCVKKSGIFMIFFVGIGFIFDGILELFLLIFDENNFLIITIKIVKTIIGMPMIIAYMMFLGCALGDIPRDLYVKYNYRLRAKKLCWTITHVMRKYKKETEFLILSINKIKMTLDLIKEKQMEELNKEISEIKDKIDSEQNKDEKKNIQKEYDNIIGIKELFNCQNEMKELLNKLEETVNYFNLNISLESIENNEEKRPLKNKKELISINETYYIYKTQIFRINYQKYSIYKEWSEIKTFMIDYKNEDLSQKINNNMKLDMESLNNSMEKENENILQSPIIENHEVQKVNLSKYKTFYYKYMPIISIILIILCIIYDILMIFGQLEYIFKWDFICGKFFRAWFTNIYLITPIRIFPMYFTLFAVCYSFISIKSDMTSCVYGHRQTEPCHALFFVGMIAKFICPLCYNFIKIIYVGIKLDGNNSKIIEYFNEQFGFLDDDENVVILVAKLAVMALFVKAIIMNITGYYGTVAYKKNQYLSYNAKYLEKELEIDEGDSILNDMNKKYGGNFEKIKEDNIIE